MRSPKPSFFRSEYTFLIPAIIVLFLVSIYPLAFSLYMSFHRFVTINPDRSFIGLANYGEVLANPDFQNSVRVSTIYTVATVGLSFAAALLLAIVLNENLRGGVVYRAIVILPLTIAPLVVGFAWKYLLDPGQGLIGAFLLPMVGIAPKAILGNPTNALVAVILADVWAKTPLLLLIILAGLQAIPKELYRAVRIDGASGFGAFLYVTLPLLKPAMIVAVMLKTIDSINAFDHIYVMTAGGPGNTTQVFAVLGVRTAFQFYNLGNAIVIGILMVIVSSIAVALMIKYLVR